MSMQLKIACLAALNAALLITLNLLLKPALIAEQSAADQRQWLDWLPANAFDNMPLAEPIALTTAGMPVQTGYIARQNGTLSALILPVTVHGYEGPITLMVAVASDGSLLASSVLAQHETSGLANLDAPSRRHWLQRFNGKRAGDNWVLRADGGAIDHISGATITSRAARDALRSALLSAEQYNWADTQ